MTAALARAPAAAPAPAAPLLRLRGLAKSFGGLPAVHPLNLDIQAQDFLAILGPSGCGKTTLLRMIGGFVEPTAGTVEIEGRDVTRLGPERRPTNTVFQGYGLFPHMNVRQNVGYGLRVQGRPRAEVADRVADALRLSRLQDLAERPVGALSGGQAQRVALARALIMRPKVLLLDEPLAALDLKLRHAMQEELRRLHAEIGGTFVFVTHDQGEAMALANRVAVMNAGRLEQEGPAEALYREPLTRFVAGFVGEANLLDARREGGRLRLSTGADLGADAGPDGPVTLVVRPQSVRLLAPGEGADGAVEGIVEEATFLGEHVRALLRLPGGEALAAHLPVGEARPERGAAVRAGWMREDRRVVPAS